MNNKLGTKNRLISILKWNEYQSSEQQIEQQVNNKRTTSEHKQECKNNKNNIISFSNKEIKEPTDDPLLKEYLDKHKGEGNTEDLIEQYFWEGLS